MSNHAMIRITKELGGIQKGSDLSLAVACRDIDVRNVRALIIGPHDTPYEFGFFEFTLKFPKDYPGKAPIVNATTTNNGRCRFNPNIYSTGKVCLSILGTWRGERGEEWSSAQGLESILISIQSLMSSNPYENEPGFEDSKTVSDKKSAKDYIMKIRHETLRISVIQRLEEWLDIQPGQVCAHSNCVIPTINTDDETSVDDEVEEEEEEDNHNNWDPFVDLCKRRFLWYYDSYLLAISKYKPEVKDGDKFIKMPFESPGNEMHGKFNYTELESRLNAIKEALTKETLGWAREGRVAMKKVTGVYINLQRQYEQCVEFYKRDSSVTLNIDLMDNNPFEWVITYFGRPMTNLDGGLFRIKLYFSIRFPEEQPRAVFETSMFHQRIAADGTPCYEADRKDDARSHISAIIEALEEENPPYDPRTMVNPEATKLYWGQPDEKKMYHRKLRRAVQRSVE